MRTGTCDDCFRVATVGRLGVPRRFVGGELRLLLLRRLTTRGARGPGDAGQDALSNATLATGDTMPWNRLPLKLRVAVSFPAWLFAVCLLLPLGLWWAGRALSLPDFLPTPYHLLGILPLLPGLTVIALSLWHFYREGRGTPIPSDPPVRLMISGPYAYCRHPLMAGQALMLLGMALLGRSWLILLALLVAAIGAQWFLRRIEEPALINRFGDRYIHYRRHVPMWLPRTTPYRPDDET